MNQLSTFRIKIGNPRVFAKSESLRSKATMTCRFGVSPATIRGVSSDIAMGVAEAMSKWTALLMLRSVKGTKRIIECWLFRFEMLSTLTSFDVELTHEVDVGWKIRTGLLGGDAVMKRSNM